jgi:hypothetical protein
VYRCSKVYYEKHSGFAEFCFRCSKWILSKIDWEAHCQEHIDNLDLPFRCDPVTFRSATACAGYCIGCLAKTWLPAAKRLQHYPERPSWQEHISECIPDYIASLPSKDPIPCPHLLCPVVLHSEADLWHHFGDIHSTHKPNIGKKRRRQREEGENERAEMQSAAKTKRPRLQGKLEDGDFKAPSGRKSAPKDRSKDPFDCKFVNMSTIDFNPSSADTLKMEGVDSSSSLCGSTSDDNVWDKHDDRQSTDTSLSSLSDDHLEAFPQTGGGCDSPWITPSEVTDDLFSDAESWNFDANADAISFPIEPLQEDWILCGPGTPSSHLSSVPTDLIDPQLQDVLPFSTPGLPATTDSVEDVHRSIPTTSLGHIESTVTQPLCGSQGVGGKPVAIDAERGIWEAEALLAKWKRGKTTWYLVNWKGFPHGDNTWQKPKDIGQKLVQHFEKTYQGNHSGVRLLKKRVSKGKVEYLIEWKGRPESENSWEKEATISSERIMDFEVNSTRESSHCI